MDNNTYGVDGVEAALGRSSSGFSVVGVVVQGCHRAQRGTIDSSNLVSAWYLLFGMLCTYTTNIFHLKLCHLFCY